MAKSEVIRQFLERNNCLIYRHTRLGGFLTPRNLCVTDFVVKQPLLCRPHLTFWTGEILAQQVPDQLIDREHPPVVVGVERGGRYLAPFIAYHLGRRLPEPVAVSCITAQRTVDGRYFLDPREEHYLARTMQALVVVDFLLRGGKVHRVIDALAHLDVKLLGIIALAARRLPRDPEVRDLPAFVGLELEPAYPRDECPQCARGEVPQEAPEDWFVEQ